jgi:methylmalonyl-CoA mutase
MGDVQEYFIKKNVRNFYSVSISGYHIAEAGANPITIGFHTFKRVHLCEYYLSRGMSINDFDPNLSFFSRMELIRVCGYGRVARKIWAKAMKK